MAKLRRVYPNASTGALAAAYRERMFLTQDELATMAGVRLWEVRKIESGAKTPSPES